ncbi:helix-turn-helix domain-containing protein [Flavobacterium sp. 83]|uniref:helix-turn-helix domain-containing protein n=1 Tax=Flavobacterium sp. 83 TaxID=1131812 RepID=UPI0005545A71|nr:helix-turn-helix domain-containing protein [Flavobacterium sp. 83]
MQYSTLVQVTPEALVKLINEGVKSQLEEFKKNLNTNDPDILLTRAEACEFLKIEQTTLYHWVKAGKVQCYGIANRRFFKKSDLMNSLTLLKK